MQHFPFDVIIDWYKHNGRHGLPWRAHFHLSPKDVGYHVWLSEIILQQTQVERGVKYYENILKEFPTIESLALTTYEEFFPFYKGLGYYSRARNMLKAASFVVSEYQGVFPEDEKELIKIPGVGPYTAQAIRAFAYDIPTLSFDTNLEKVFSRFYFGTKYNRLTLDEKIALLKQYIDSGISGREINSALMDFASLVDLNNKDQINWENYPLKDSIFYKSRGQSEIKEVKAKTVKKPHTRETKKTILVHLHENHLKYFSTTKDTYTPFVLECTSGDIRHLVQEMFREIYNLEVSVRPPHKKENAIFEVNAQVQSGNHSFYEFDKSTR